MQVIGISGGGARAIAETLAGLFPYLELVSFRDPARDMVAAGFNWPDRQNPNVANFELGQSPYDLEMSPRRWGESMHPALWVRALQSRLKQGGRYLVPSVATVAEAEFVRSRGTPIRLEMGRAELDLAAADGDIVVRSLDDLPRLAPQLRQRLGWP